ncbi:hypothetical protein QF026_001376 [Streptomyces aurantiacus]|nr:hypothetical protein [Streptomyces aurantiacus]
MPGHRLNLLHEAEDFGISPLRGKAPSKCYIAVALVHDRVELCDLKFGITHQRVEGEEFGLSVQFDQVIIIVTSHGF